MRAIIFAGGKAQRLLPLTEERPKILMDIGGQPLLDILLRQLRDSGVERVTLCVSHLQTAIREHLFEAIPEGLVVDFSVDAQPRGTAGPLLLVADWDEPTLVLNGDVLTDLDFADVHRVHQSSGCAMTIACRQTEVTIDSGALEIVDDRVYRMTEKPRFRADVSMGVYVVDPSVRSFIPADSVVDMPDLITSLIGAGQSVGAYRFTGSWHDIGTPGRYERAVAEFTDTPEVYLPGVGRGGFRISHAN